LMMSYTPALGFQVGVLSCVEMWVRSRSPDMTLLYLTVIPTYLSLAIYGIICDRRGPILYFWAFEAVMPIFSMWVNIKTFFGWCKDERGWSGGRQGGAAPASDEPEAALESGSGALLDQRLSAVTTSSSGTTSFATSSKGGVGSWVAGSWVANFAPKNDTSRDRKELDDSDRFELSLDFDGLQAHQLAAAPHSGFGQNSLNTFNYEHDAEVQFRASARLSAFGFVRWFAAIHIVMFHYYKKADWNPRAPFDWVFLDWGGQWVQFFFVLGGFMMSFTRLCKPGRETESSFTVWKSSIRKVYPAYLLSIVLPLLRPGRLNFYWRILPSQLTLTFSWGWWLGCSPPPGEPQDWHNFFCIQGLNEPAWYLCCLQVYWLLFPHVHRRIVRWELLEVICLGIFCWAMTLFWPVFFAFREAQPWGSNLSTFQAFNPVSHFHKFVFGMCLARMFVDKYCTRDGGRLRIDDAKIRRVAETIWFAPAGLAIILYCFLSGRLEEFILFSLSSYETVLLPAFGLLIVGLAFEADPITRLLTKQPFKFLADHNISYEIYILQGIVYSILSELVISKETGTEKELNVGLFNALYLVVINAVAIVVCLYLTEPNGTAQQTSKPTPHSIPLAAQKTIL